MNGIFTETTSVPGVMNGKNLKTSGEKWIRHWSANGAVKGVFGILSENGKNILSMDGGVLWQTLDLPAGYSGKVKFNITVSGDAKIYLSTAHYTPDKFRYNTLSIMIIYKYSIFASPERPCARPVNAVSRTLAKPLGYCINFAFIKSHSEKRISRKPFLEI